MFDGGVGGGGWSDLRDEDEETEAGILWREVVMKI
jgi:hypothetical protein